MCVHALYVLLYIQEIKSLKKKLHASEGKVEELETTVKELREAEESSSFLQPPLIDLDTSLSLSDSTPSRDFNSPIPTDAKEVCPCAGLNDMVKYHDWMQCDLGFHCKGFFLLGGNCINLCNG